MRIPINLASEPFRRDRPLVAGSVAVGVLLLGLLAMLISLAAGERARAAEARNAITKTDAELKKAARDRASMEAVLRQPQNAEVLDRSLFLNDLLARKGVSWTRIFADLESVTPHNVRVITVRPQIRPNNELLLDMVVGSQSAEAIYNDFVMKLEASSMFGKTLVHNTLPPSQTEPLFRSRVSVTYGQKL